MGGARAAGRDQHVRRAGRVSALFPAALTSPPAAVGFELGGVPMLDVAMFAVPATIGMTVLRHRLYDIDVVFNRALVYLALTAVLLGLYLGMVAVVDSLLPIGGRDPAVALPRCGAGRRLGGGRG